MLSLKGLSFTIVVSICIVLSAAVAAASSIPSGAPFVLNANEVPVVGGVLYIYGLNLGEDASQIKVEILDNANGGVIECINISIVLPNSVLSCSIVDIGTGRSKHIAVTVNGVSNDIKADSNMVFNRHAPKLHTITYALEKSLVIIHGSNFGNNAGLVSVSLDGNKYPVVSVNDSFIVCSRLSDNEPPTSRMAIVEVDGQGSTENLTVIVDASVSSDKVEIDHIPLSPAGSGSSEGGYNGVIPKDKIKLAWIVVGAAAGVATISIFVIGLLVMRKRRIQRELDAAAAATASVTVVTDPMDHLVGTTLPPLTRDQSMVEIDLKEDLTGSGSYTSSRRNSVYEQNECMASDSSDSSSSSSSMSPMSSNCSTPADSPFSSPVGSPMASHKNDSEIPEGDNTNNSSYNSSNNNSENETPVPVFPKIRRPLPPPLDLDSDAKSAFSMTPPTTGPHAKSSAKMRGMIRVPSSRIANRALDSPYFAKQGAFDSPKQGAFDSPNM